MDDNAPGWSTIPRARDNNWFVPRTPSTACPQCLRLRIIAVLLREQTRPGTQKRIETSYRPKYSPPAFCAGMIQWFCVCWDLPTD